MTQIALPGFELLATGGHRTILMDPPWPETGGGNRGADVHYDVATVDEILGSIRAMRTRDGAPAFRPDVAAGCHLFMWATETFYGEALWLIRALGFRKVSSIVWVKGKVVGAEVALEIGLGQYARHCHEHLLVATAGPAGPPPPHLRGPSVEVCPRPRIPGTKKPWHSRKPDLFYDRVEDIGAAPRVEIFARVPRRPGWEVAGREAAGLASGPSPA